MKYLPITLIATLSASLLMALIFVPTVGAYIGKPGAADPATMRALAAGEKGNLSELGNLTGLYIRVLDRAIARPGLILLGALVVLVGVYAAYGKYGRGVEFFPEIEPDRAIVQVHARGNLAVDEQAALVIAVERHILALNQETGEIATIYTRAGAAQQGGASDQAEDVIGSIQIEFEDWSQRRPASEILADIMARSRSVAGIVVETTKEEGGPPVGKPIHIQLSATDAGLLEPAIAKIRAYFETLDGLKDVEDNRALPGIDWQIKVDRTQAAKYGADVTSVGQAIQFTTKGLKFSDYRPDDSDEEVDIAARYPFEYRTLEQLDRIRVQTEAGLVPIGNFVTRTAQPKVGTVRRTDSRRVMDVKADVRDGVLADAKLREIQTWVAAADFDPSIRFTYKGEDEEQRKAEDFLLKAFAVALFVMAIILVTQFNRFYSALLILTAVIMSTVGVLIGLMTIGQPFGIVMSGIGVIALAGIVVNNNIVLIDTFDRLSLTTKNVREAILRTGAQRLRPVLLTTITTMLGLMPMVLRVNIDFVTREVSLGAPSTQWWQQLSTAVVFGLGFATVLTLVVTPSALMLRANVGAAIGRMRARRSERPAANAAGAD